MLTGHASGEPAGTRLKKKSGSMLTGVMLHIPDSDLALLLCLPPLLVLEALLL